jgi:hypothetical protein
MCSLGYCHAFLLSAAGVDVLELFFLALFFLFTHMDMYLGVPTHPHQQ